MMPARNPRGLAGHSESTPTPRAESAEGRGVSGPRATATPTILAPEGRVRIISLEGAAAKRERNGAQRAEKRRRRILLAASSQRLRRELTHALAREGHEVMYAASRGAALVSAVEHGGALHAVVVSQGFLGEGWPALVRSLRRRAPRVPIVLLLRPGAEWAWRFAFVAGAYDALPASAGAAAVLETVRRALICPLGRDPEAAPALRKDAVGAGAGLRDAAAGRAGMPPAALP